MTDKQLVPVWVVIPAAGIGQRMMSELPKQYLKIHDKTLIEHTLDCFLENQQIAGIVVVLSAADSHWQTLNIKSELKPILTVQGGSDRSDSVMEGLKFLEKIMKIPKPSWIIVHDAARPCLSADDLDAVLAIRETDTIGGLLASPVRDTMKRSVIFESAVANSETSSINVVSHTESRKNLWHALTPQIFRLGALQSALSYCEKEGFEITDESSAMEYIGEKPLIVESIHNNIKVTHPSDIQLVAFLLSEKRNNKEEI